MTKLAIFLFSAALLCAQRPLPSPVNVGGGGGGVDPVPGYPANQVISGCGVEYVTGLTFTVGAPCNYSIGGIAYTISTNTTVTLTAASMSDPRIDVIAVDNSAAEVTLTGTPATPALQPTVDPSTQLPLTFIYVPAGATTPQGITITNIYNDNTEWTCTPSTHFNCNSTTNPYRGTKDIEATTAVLGNNVVLVKPTAGTTDLSTQNTLIFYIRSKATWPSGNGSGASGLRTLSLYWLNGSTQVGNQVVLQNGAFGFVTSNTSSYQQIQIPISLFGAGSNLVTSLEAKVTGNGGSSSIGFYLDEITLQAGTNSFTLPTTLMNFKGTWSAAAAYNIFDTVVSSGVGYVALVANTNVAVATASTWATLSTAGGSSNQNIRAIVGAFDGGGSVLTTAAVAYIPVPFACTLTNFTITVDAGTISFDVWKVATGGTAIPTVSNTIISGASYLAIASGTKVGPSSITSSLTSVAVTANDTIGIKIQAIATATKATLMMQCNATT